MKRFSLNLNQATALIKYSLLPIVGSIYPVLFHYANNINFVPFQSTIDIFFLMSGISIALFIFFYWASGYTAANAAIKAFIFLLFFHTYGITFNVLQQWDVIQIEHFTFLPFYILMAIYAGWFIAYVSGQKSHDVWNGIFLIIVVLAASNLIKFFPVESQQYTSEQVAAANINQSASYPNSPDIYYIIFDEMAGFDVIRQYWKYSEIDQFVGWLKSKGFYVAENSRASVPYTFYEVATRLNYEQYPFEPETPLKYTRDNFKSISDSRVMSFLKSIGYTTVGIDQKGEAYKRAIPLKVDFLYENSGDEIIGSSGIFDEFGVMVLGNSMLQPLANQHKIDNSAINAHRRMIFFATNKIGNLQDIPSPKIVYVHLLLPHIPFTFDTSGGVVPSELQGNWDNYLGQYIFTTKIAKTMIENILASYDSNNYPVIIIQSDHGARNLKDPATAVYLENYPEEYKLHIVNTMFLPGCEKAPLTQNINPINIFPIVFNCYFNANIPLK